MLRRKRLGPDGKLIVTVSAESGKPIYSILYNGKIFLEKSPLGLKTNVGDFSEGLVMDPANITSNIDETYEFLILSSVRYNTRQLRVFLHLPKGTRKQLILYFM